MTTIDREKVQQNAQRFVDKKRYDLAIVEYRKLVEADPKDTRNLLKIGDLLARTGDYAGAIDTYERVAKVYVAQGFAVKAIAVYKQVKELLRKHAPELADRYVHITPRLADIYVQLGLVSDAVTALDEVATAHQKGGRDRDAVAVFRKMVEVDPRNPLVQLRFAEALIRTSAAEEAIEAFWTAAQLMLEQGRKDHTLKVIERILHFKQDPRFALVAADIYLERNTREDGLQALAKLQICFQQDPKDLATLQRLARAFETIDSIDKSTAVKKELARIAREKGDLELFRRTVDELQATAPDDEGVRALSALRNTSSSAPSVAPARGPITEVDPQELEEAEEIEEAEELEASQPSARPSMPPPRSAPQRRAPEPVAAEPVAAQVREQSVASQLAVGEQVEEVGAQAFDSSAHLRKSLVDAESFRNLGLFAKAVETLSIALEMEPRSIEIREKLVQILSEAGEWELAYGEQVNVASLYFDEGQFEYANSLVTAVLQQYPEHAAAMDLYTRIYYAQAGYDPSAYQEAEPSQGYAQPEAEAPAQGYAPDGYAPQYAGSEAIYDPQAPLPSYDLEGVSMVLAPKSTAPSLDDVDDPFGNDAPLPSFPLGDEAPTDVGSPPSDSFAAAGVEEALDEAEFFAAQGLLEDARAVLVELLTRLPGHPLISDKLAEIDEQLQQRAPDESGPLQKAPLSQEIDDTFELASSLDAIEAPVESVRRGFSAEVDVDQVFEKFKEGVRAQVSDSDSATHYDLGVAYKEMGLLTDSVHEFELAARDERREATCFSMIGLIYLQLGDMERAITAYRRGLEARVVSPEQRLSLEYDLGSCCEQAGRSEEALAAFRRIEQRDASYRDVKQRIAALTGDKKASGARPIGEEDEFDHIFDDLFESK